MPALRQASNLMKRVYQATSLALLLIVGQQGAVVHEMSHVRSAHGADVRAGAHEATETVCALCPSFAQVVTPAFSHSFIPPLLLRAEAERSSPPRIAAADAAIPTPRSRGPPTSS